MYTLNYIERNGHKFDLKGAEEKQKRDHISVLHDENDNFLNSLKKYVGFYGFKFDDNESQKDLKN